MSGHELLAPTEVERALALLVPEDRPVLLAGGTDLWPAWTQAGRRPERVLSLHRLRELRLIEWRETEGVLRIGATCTHADLVRSPLVRRASPALAEAAATIGAAQIQNRGTIGGNIVNGSPAADLPPPLVAAGAELELVSARGARRVALDRFFIGYRRLDRRPDELLVAIHVPAVPAGARERFRKVGTRRAQAIAKVSAACRLVLGAEHTIARAGLALGSVGPTVVRLGELETWLVGRRLDAETALEAERRAAAAVQPIDDLRSTAAYRRYVAGRLVRRFIFEGAEGSRAPRQAPGAGGGDS